MVSKLWFWEFIELQPLKSLRFHFYLFAPFRIMFRSMFGCLQVDIIGLHAKDYIG